MVSQQRRVIPLPANSVCHITYEFPPRIYGGLGRHVHRLTTELTALGWGVTVATAGHHGGADSERGGGAVVHRVPGLRMIGDGGDWLEAVRAFDAALPPVLADAAGGAAVLHVHDWFASQAALAHHRRTRIPLVATVHATERGRHQGWLPDARNRAIDAAERNVAEAADLVIVCSDWMGRTIAHDWKLPSDKIRVVANGTDPTASRAGPRHGVLFAGRLEHEKGGQVLLEAVARLEGGHRPAVTFAGEGSQKAQWRRQAETLGVGARFTGHLDAAQLNDEYARAAVVVVPSLYEPFGLVACEAMAAGAAVVAADVGGLAETVSDGGTLVPPGDADALAEAIRALLDDEHALRAAAKRARARAAALPSWRDTATATAAVYAELMGPDSAVP